MREPTPQDVKDFWTFMTTRYGTTAVNKAISPESDAMASILDTLGITDAEAFKTQFVTTIGKTIYCPFEIGDVSTGWSLWSQIEVCAHEHQHVVQSDAMGALQFSEYYLLSKAGRSVIEAEAYTVSMAMYAWHYGCLPDLDAYADYMGSYGVDAADISYVDKHIRLVAPAILQGALPPEAGVTAQKWLDAHIPELRA